MMDSKKSDNDARIKIFEAIENLCHSKDISAKEIAQILYESFSIKSDFFQMMFSMCFLLFPILIASITMKKLSV